MNPTPFIAILLIILTFISTSPLAKDEQSSKKKSLELEKLFPKKSMFGPSARGMSFSKNGRYAAYLYRTFPNRRHGNDLWVYDFKTGKTQQITHIDMMSEFQRSARLVIEDRLKRHKPSKKNKSKKEEKNSKKSAAKKNSSKKSQVYLNISDELPDDDYAPVYSGISSFVWHPTENELLLSSEGDIYHIKNINKPNLARLTKTNYNETQVRFLPDGSGYTFMANNNVVQVKFDSSFQEQLIPTLPTGEKVSRYEFSHDGRRMIIVSNKGGQQAGARKVDVIRYRNRFAKSEKISRTVSDDKVKPRQLKIYLYDIGQTNTEKSELIQIFEQTIDEPRDTTSLPKWSLDNQQVTFSIFDQKNSNVHIHLASWPTEDELKKAKEKAKKKYTKKRNENIRKAKKKDKEERSPGKRGPKPGRKAAVEIVEHQSKIIYQFKHYGGPNTPRMIAPDFSGENNHIVFISEQSGFRHVHKIDPLYETTQQLTNGRFEVYPFQFSDDRKTLFVIAGKESAAQKMIYALDIESGKLTRLNKKRGNFSSAAVSDDGKNLIANFVTYGQLREVIVQKGKNNMKTITDSHSKEAKQHTKIKPELFQYKNRHGHSISAKMFKPKNWKKSNKHPLLIYVYGGPLGTRHSVNDGSYSSDAYFFQMYMAQKHGYITMVVDPRGQSGYGGLFEKSNYEQVGKPQVEDLVDGVKYMKENFNINDKKVAIHGWSFGGFQTQMCLYTKPDVFQVGMAGAGPTQWENYNSWYTTGTVGPSRKGKTDQEKYSLIPLAKNLKGQLLLVHGMEDFNVLFQDTIAIYRALLKAGKETHVELFLDPTGGHGLGGDVKRLGRMRKYEEFLLRTIGSGY